MAPRNQSTTNNGKEKLRWTRSMDDALIDAFMHEYNEGNKVNDTFTTTAYDNIVQELSAIFGKKIDKEKVKNRWKTLKKNFSKVYDIFKSGMSGFAWNPSTHLWDAESEVWDALIESKPKAANWRNTPTPNYEKMVILYGNDRATYKDAETAFKMRKRRCPTIEEDFFKSIDDIDNLDSRNETTFDNIDPFVDATTISNFSTQDPSSEANNGSKKKKNKVVEKKDKVDELNEIRGVIYEVANAIREATNVLKEGNARMRECNKNKLPPIGMVPNSPPSS